MTNSENNDSIRVIKQDHLGRKTLEYSGEVLGRGDGWVCVLAQFNFDDKDRGYVVFRRGDTFIEWHYSDRWYNVFELHDVDDGHFKGWYCNITRPAILTEDTVRADDLALDLFFFPNRQSLLLDEDEFNALDLPPDEQGAVWSAVEALQKAVAAGEAPFGAIG